MTAKTIDEARDLAGHLDEALAKREVATSALVAAWEDDAPPAKVSRLRRRVGQAEDDVDAARAANRAFARVHPGAIQNQVWVAAQLRGSAA